MSWHKTLTNFYCAAVVVGSITVLPRPSIQSLCLSVDMIRTGS